MFSQRVQWIIVLLTLAGSLAGRTPCVAVDDRPELERGVAVASDAHSPGNASDRDRLAPPAAANDVALPAARRTEVFCQQLQLEHETSRGACGSAVVTLPALAPAAAMTASPAFSDRTPPLRI